MLPFPTEGFGGATLIDCRNPPVTVRFVEPRTPSTDALMVVVPILSAVTSPLLETVATDGAEEFQVALGVKFSVLKSL